MDGASLSIMFKLATLYRLDVLGLFISDTTNSKCPGRCKIYTLSNALLC